MKKILGLLTLVLVSAGALAACGDSQGDSCTTDNDCGSNLFCQAITGRGDKCCPTPPESSDNVSCHGIGESTMPSEPVVTSTQTDSGL
jgi:hypothetical protein